MSSRAAPHPASSASSAAAVAPRARRARDERAARRQVQGALLEGPAARRRRRLLRAVAAEAPHVLDRALPQRPLRRPRGAPAGDGAAEGLDRVARAQRPGDGSARAVARVVDRQPQVAVDDHEVVRRAHLQDRVRRPGLVGHVGEPRLPPQPPDHEAVAPERVDLHRRRVPHGDGRLRDELPPAVVDPPQPDEAAAQVAHRELAHGRVVGRSRSQRGSQAHKGRPQHDAGWAELFSVDSRHRCLVQLPATSQPWAASIDTHTTFFGPVSRPVLGGDRGLRCAARNLQPPCKSSLQPTTYGRLNRRNLQPAKPAHHKFPSVSIR